MGAAGAILRYSAGMENLDLQQPALPPELAARMADLYRRMEEEYDQVARQLDFSCQGCPDNCCDSYFQHHTRIEWAYLWEGLRQLPTRQREAIYHRARQYQRGQEEALAADQRPALLCPLNEDGLCGLYAHRLMICRLHGVPATISFPGGRQQQFPGCWRCQELAAHRREVPTMERSPLLRELAALEQRYHPGGHAPGRRIKMTIAEMIIAGPP